MNLMQIADKVNRAREAQQNKEAALTAEVVAKSDSFRDALIAAANTGLYSISIVEISDVPRQYVDTPAFQRTLNKYLKPYGAKLRGYRISWDQ